MTKKLVDNNVIDTQVLLSNPFVDKEIQEQGIVQTAVNITLLLLLAVTIIHEEV